MKSAYEKLHSKNASRPIWIQVISDVSRPMSLPRTEAGNEMLRDAYVLSELIVFERQIFLLQC